MILRRIVQAFPLLLLLSILIFGLIHAVPGGPLTVYLSNPQVRPEDIARLERALGLDRPVYEQYLRWLGNFVQGDWGYSYADGQPVLQRIAERLPATIELMGAGLFLAAVIAFPVGLWTAVRRNSVGDYVATFLAFAGISLPVYWLGLMAQLAVGLELGWLPISGRQSFGRTDWWDHLLHLVLPATVLAFAHIAAWSRYLRSSVSGVLGQPFVAAARSKGLAPRTILMRHVLRNALLPVLTVVFLDLAFVLSGAVITESIFAWPGIGSLFVDSIFRRDYSVIMGVLMMGATAVVIANLVADLLYTLIDPRIRYSKAAS